MNQLVFRGTNKGKGRYFAVTPENSPMRHLHYGRIILDAEVPTVAFETGRCETGLICLAGRGRVAVGGETHELERYDAIYIPRGSRVEVSTEAGVDFIECAAPVEGDYPLQVVRLADVERDSSLRFTTGGPTSTRTITILIGKNVRAGRLLAGFTRSEPGHWTSWPPHEHAEMLEELYVFYDMPAPSFGVQFVFNEAEEPEFAGAVRDGDVVLMPYGYHPNVAIPGYPINFVWIMAAHKEIEYRQYGVVNVHPDFAASGSGLEASRR